MPGYFGHLLLALGHSPHRIEPPPHSVNPPGIPQNVVAVSTGPTSTSVSWDAVSGADSYVVERESPIGGGFSTADAAFVGTTFADTGRSIATEYNYRISATNETGTSSPSAEADATTDAAAPAGAITGKVYRTDSASSAKTATWGVLLPEGALTDTDNLRLYVDDIEVTPAVQAAGGTEMAPHPDGSIMAVFVQWSQSGDLATPLVLELTTDSARTIGTGSFSNPTINSSTGLPDVYGMMDDPDQIVGSGVLPATVSRDDTPASAPNLTGIDTSFDAWEVLRRTGAQPTSNKWDRGLVYLLAWARLPKGHAMQQTWFQHAMWTTKTHQLAMAGVTPAYSGNEWNNTCESWAYHYLLTGDAAMASACGSVATAFYRTKTVNAAQTALYDGAGGRGWNHGCLYSLNAWRIRGQGSYTGQPLDTPASHLTHALNVVDLAIDAQLVEGSLFPGPFTADPADGEWYTSQAYYPDKAQWYMGSMIGDAIWEVDQRVSDSDIQAATPAETGGRATRRADLRACLLAHATSCLDYGWNATGGLFDYEFDVTSNTWGKIDDVASPYGGNGAAFLVLHMLGIAYQITSDSAWLTAGDAAMAAMFARIGSGPSSFFSYRTASGVGNYTNDEQCFNEVFSQSPKYLGLRS